MPFIIVIIAILVLFVFSKYLSKLQRVFTISIVHGQAELLEGKAPQSFVRDCAIIAQIAHLTNGKIYGIKNGGRIKLVFSKNIPETVHQNFRNV